MRQRGGRTHWLLVSAAMLVFSAPNASGQTVLQPEVWRPFSISLPVIPAQCQPPLRPGASVTCSVMPATPFAVEVGDDPMLLQVELRVNGSPSPVGSLSLRGNFGTAPSFGTTPEISVVPCCPLGITRNGQLQTGIYYFSPVFSFTVFGVGVGSVKAEGEIRVSLRGGPAINTLSVCNAASRTSRRPDTPGTAVGGVSSIAPGTVVSISGVELGPVEEASMQLPPDGLFAAKELAGVKVRFNEVDAPVLFASSGRVDAIVPYSIAPTCTLSLVNIWNCNYSVTVQVERDGNQSNEAILAVAPFGPNIYTRSGDGTGQAVAVNENGSDNSPDNPAARGSLLTVFLTGSGALDPAPEDGEILGSDPPRAITEFKANVGPYPGQDADVVFIGGVPGLVAGQERMQIRVPANAPVGAAVAIRIGRPGQVWSQDGVTVAIQ